MTNELKGINICNCSWGDHVTKQFYKVEKETPRFYILNSTFGVIKVEKTRTKEQAENERNIFTKTAKLLDDDGTVLEIMKDYYKFSWAELVY